MKQTVPICVAALFTMGSIGSLSPAAAESATYEIDPGHTALYFQVNHVGFSNMFGRFNKMSGSVVFDPDDPAPHNIAFIGDVSRQGFVEHGSEIFLTRVHFARYISGAHQVSYVNVFDMADGAGPRRQGLDANQPA